MSKKKTRENTYFPVPSDLSLSKSSPIEESPGIKKQIVQQAIKSAYMLETPTEPGPWSPDYGTKPEALVSTDQVELITSLMQSLQPHDAIEAALSTQFVATYIQGMKSLQKGYTKQGMPLLEFGHKVLDTLQKYRSKGAQQIQVNYNVNQGQQVFNVKNTQIDCQSKTEEVDVQCQKI